MSSAKPHNQNTQLPFSPYNEHANLGYMAAVPGEEEVEQGPGCWEVVVEFVVVEFVLELEELEELV